MVSEGTSEQRPRQIIGKRDKRLGYERTTPAGPPPPLKDAYVSPYKQAPPLAPVRSSKSMIADALTGYGSSGSGQIPGQRGKAGGSKSQKLYKNASVDELMARIGMSITSSVPMSRLHSTEDAQKSPRSKPKNRQVDDEVDDATVCSHASQGSLASHGSFGSLRSHGSVSVMSKTSISGQRYQAVQVEVEDSSTVGGVRIQEYTMRSMIDQIANSAKQGKAVPSFVPSVEELPERFFSWNGKDNFKAVMAMKTRAGRGAKKLLPPVTSMLPLLGVTKDRAQHEHEKALAAMTSISELDGGDDMSYNSNTGSTIHNKSSKRVDIIGMYQNVPLILARADERCRKQAAVLAAKIGITEDRREKLMQRIAFNMSRSERYAEALRVRQLQIAWLKVVKLMAWQSTFMAIRAEIKERYGYNKKRIWAATTLAFAITQFIRNRLKKKIDTEFKAAIKSSFFILVTAIKCKRKMFALRRIKYFLSLFQGKNRIKEVVHRFVKSALLIQRNGRGFVACHRARIEALIKIWDKLEVEYIEEVLAKRKQAERSAGLVEEKKKKGKKGTNKKDANPIVDEKTRIEMEKQAKRWQDQEDRMEDLLDRHRKTGLIVKESLRGNALLMVLPYSIKHRCVQGILDMKRKEFLIKTQAAAAEYAKTLDIFKVDDASDLLAGNMQKINSLIKTKYQSSLSWFRSGQKSLFTIFRNTDAEKRRGEDVKSIMLPMIKEQHDRAGTFVLKIRTPKKTGRGFDMEGHKKKAASKAAAATAAAKEQALNGSAPAAGSRPGTSIVFQSNPNSRPGTSSVGAGGSSGTEGKRKGEEKEEKGIIENKAAVGLLKMMMGGKK